MTKVSVLPLSIALLIAASAPAQRGAPALRSPEILPDHRVTFRISSSAIGCYGFGGMT